MHKISIQKQRQILNLAYEGESVRSIAKKTKINWRTARKYKHQFDLAIEQGKKEIETKIQGDLDHLSFPGIIKKILHL